jgi:membrane-associated phospholipid phosphatase
LREAKLNDPFVNAKIFATLNMAMADAAIACWDAKYTYWYLRPSQADAAITVPIGLPNHPSYPSGHSCISSAASEVLAHFIPNRANDLREATKQASISRLYAGIHWRFDAEAGLEIGQKIAALAIRKL